MRNMNRKRALLFSGAVILLCMTVVTGMTWALFTDTKTVTNHLQAGDLEITLKRTELVKNTLNGKGFLEEITVQKSTDVPEDFTTSNDKNVFGLESEEKVVPGSEFVATMQIENNSDVAFGYWVRIECEDEDVAKKLAEQMIIKVYTDKNGDGTIDTDDSDGSDESDKSVVASGLEVGSDKNFIGVLGIDDKETFIVSVEFDNQGYTYVDGVLTSTNDAAQKQDIDFDLIVYAVQVTTQPTTP